MKNKILILISLLIFVLAIKNVYAEETATVKCTASDFRSGRYGCKDTYKMETYFGGYVTATCIKEYYEKGTYGCKDTYEVNSKGKVEVACTDSDFDKGTHGCKKTYENEVYPGWSVDVTCEAAFYETGEHGCKDTYEVNYVSTSNNESWWKNSYIFWNGAQSDVAKDAMNTLEPLIDLIKIVGNMIFVGVTVILGVKYIWGSVESKASVKESLVTLVVAALVFYGWNTISALILDENMNTLIFINDEAEITAMNIYTTILYICNFLAIGGIVYVGIRYMMAGAEGRAQLKAKSVPIVLGIIMVYATITFLNFIVGIL